MPERIDVLGLGAVAVDDLLFLEEFPLPDGKYQVLYRERRSGGLSGTALVAAARLGCRAAYAGRLGKDELSRFVIEGLEAEGVDTVHVVEQEGALPYRSTILVEKRGQTRTILGESTGVKGADDSLPAEAVIRCARVLLVDHTGLSGMLRAARLARGAGIPVVADFERPHPAPFAELYALADHLILPLQFARELTGAPDGRTAAEALWSDSRAAIVVTMGAEGSWYLPGESPGRAQYQAAFRVEAVDTTGCGDVFHGAYAAFLSQGMKIGERVRLAAAAAAIKATRPGGQQGIPASAELRDFLAAHAGQA
jgi:sugar/nucleoside kinase (ribokinase family)